MFSLFSSKPAPPSSPEGSTAMDSDTLKKSIIKQILVESNTSNAKQLIEVCRRSCLPRLA